MTTFGLLYYTGMAGKGPTRTALQPQCIVAPMSEVQSLRGHFQAARQLLLQGEQYYMEGELVHVSVGGLICRWRAFWFHFLDGGTAAIFTQFSPMLVCVGWAMMDRSERGLLL